jgi:hypothetical protein
MRRYFALAGHYVPAPMFAIAALLATGSLTVAGERPWGPPNWVFVPPTSIILAAIAVLTVTGWLAFVQHEMYRCARCRPHPVPAPHQGRGCPPGCDCATLPVHSGHLLVLWHRISRNGAFTMPVALGMFIIATTGLFWSSIANAAWWVAFALFWTLATVHRYAWCLCKST